jgi:hypothetical protein
LVYRHPQPDEKAQGFIRAMARELLVENPTVNTYWEAELLAYETWARSQYLSEPAYIFNLEKKLINKEKSDDTHSNESME